MSADIIPFVCARDRLIGENDVSRQLTVLLAMNKASVADAIQYGIARYRKNGFHVDNAVADAFYYATQLERNGAA